MMQDKNQKTDSTQAQDNATAAINRAAQGDFVRKIVEKIKSSENILVALSRNPSVDEISAAIGLSLFLDGMQKHTTAIYSGQTPEALAFLKPEATFETNTDSLQDFIISLSKDKADHLRYKLEGDFVKVYITPYKSTINEEDLTFSQGDYNVDFVIALNVPSASELDEALAEHGRIMHDASAVDITRGMPGKFGEIEWSNPAASSVSEMVTELIFRLQGSDKKLDVDVATALLTGIVAATERFSNNRTTPETLKLASKLMEMGADQQLISANVMDNQKLGDGTPAPVRMDDSGMMADFGTPVMGAANVASQDGVPGFIDTTVETTVENPAVGMAGAEAASGVAAEAPIMETNQVVPEDVVVQPILPEGMTAEPGMAEAAFETAGASGALAGMPEVSAGGAEVPAEGNAEALATGVPEVPAEGIPEVKKDYAKMLEQALAEEGPVMDPVAQVPPVAPAQPAPEAQAMPETQQTQQQMPPMPNVAPGAAPNTQPTAELVANPYVEVLPPPPAPVAGSDMMPPSLPPVQMPAGA